MSCYNRRSSLDARSRNTRAGATHHSDRLRYTINKVGAPLPISRAVLYESLYLRVGIDMHIIVIEHASELGCCNPPRDRYVVRSPNRPAFDEKPVAVGRFPWQSELGMSHRAISARSNCLRSFTQELSIAQAFHKELK